jgi:hypothetical protein
MAGQEFRHAHAQGDFSLYVTLPSRCPPSPSRPGGPNPTSSCTPARRRRPSSWSNPRDDLERDVDRRLVRVSYEFALAPSGQTVARTYGRPYHQAPN